MKDLTHIDQGYTGSEIHVYKREKSFDIRFSRIDELIWGWHKKERKNKSILIFALKGEGLKERKKGSGTTGMNKVT